jgi:predicted TIM-barrel fold metal-dependent hydrolase
MDAQGIDVEAISINPFWYRAEHDIAAEVIKVNNETLTVWCAAYPERFLGFASVALQFPDLAVHQLEYAIKTLHKCGVAVGASVAGAEFSDPMLHRFGPNARNSASCSSCIRRARRISRRRCRATVGWRTPLAIPSTPRSRCRT